LVSIKIPMNFLKYIKKILINLIKKKIKNLPFLIFLSLISQFFIYSAKFTKYGVKEFRLLLVFSFIETSYS